MITEEMLYSDLIPGLGERALPMLFARLRMAAETGNRYVTGQIVKGIACIGGSDGGVKAIEMLNDPSPGVQRAGMLLLAESPNALALERLWELHCQGQADPTPFLSEHEQDFVLYEDSYGALRSCCRLNPAWLETAIAKANPATEPVHDLAYLVSGLNDDGAMWKRCKENLRTKVPVSKERSLAMNILHYQDKDEIEWLLDRVSRADDLVGPVAFQALVQIDESLALDHLTDVPERELYCTRHWFLPDLLMRRPRETRERLLHCLQEHPNPWQFAHVFQGVENAIDVSILNILLDTLEPLLRTEIEHGLPENQGSVVWSCEFVAQLTDLELLNCLRQRRNTAFEKALVDWLLWRGPQNSGFVEHDKQNALGVLSKIGGNGLATVVNDWLTRGNRYSRLDAMKLSARGWTPETMQLLRERSLGDELWEGRPIEQGYAADALATMGDWQDVVRFLVQWGIDTLTRATDHRRSVERLDDIAMLPATEKATSNQLLEPGVAMALAFGHRDECLGMIHDTLAASNPDSESSHACVIAMWWIADTTDNAVPLLTRQLSVPSQRHNVTNALLINHTDAAITVLLQHIRKEYDWQVAAILLNDERVRDEVMPLVKKSLLTGHSINSETELHHLLRRVRDAATLTALFSDVDVQEVVRQQATCQEGSFWCVGTKATAVEALAMVDSRAAYAAALAALQNDGSHDREMYPYLMAQIDANRSVRDLIEQAQTERHTSVLWSIARALSKTDCLEAVRMLITSMSPKEREVGCKLCIHGEFGEALEESLRHLLKDPMSDVACAAREALEVIESRQNTNRLLKAILDETDHSHRWSLLDALIASADPGDERQPWPEWASRIVDTLPFVMRRHLSEGIDKRRKDVREEANKRDR